VIAHFREIFRDFLGDCYCLFSRAIFFRRLMPAMLDRVVGGNVALEGFNLSEYIFHIISVCTGGIDRAKLTARAASPNPDYSYPISRVLSRHVRRVYPTRDVSTARYFVPRTAGSEFNSDSRVAIHVCGINIAPLCNRDASNCIRMRIRSSVDKHPRFDNHRRSRSAFRRRHTRRRSR